jgi:acyl dehydratase
MTTAVRSLEELQGLIGKELALSEWIPITQEQVNAFASATLDMDWMHVDPARARTGPIGQTIAQGFLTLSLLTFFSHQSRLIPAGIEYAFNYGVDRVRWMTPVKVGASIRNRARLLDLQPRGPDGYLIKTENTVEILGEDKPAMVAEWLGLLKKTADQAR